MLQGDKGFSVKSAGKEASYYFSQPFFTAKGVVTINGQSFDVSGRAWMDREWGSDPLGEEHRDWDWFSLHLSSGEKIMIYRHRSKDGSVFYSGNWVSENGANETLGNQDISVSPEGITKINEKDIPTSWKVKINSHNLEIQTRPVNPNSWMGTKIAYWEGPIQFEGTHKGEGYMELVGY